MQKDKKTYHATELARMFGIHSNTIRIYEKWGFISTAQRNTNNYRMFEELHVLQIKVCRCIFGYSYTNRRIRNAGNEALWAMARREWDAAEQCTEHYIKMIEQEIRTAQNAAERLQSWANPTDEKETPAESGRLSRKEAADYLGVTIEAVRNWERNGLIAPDGVGEKGETLYSGDDLGRMCVIFMLLQAGFSISSIHRSISMYDKGCAELVTSSLNNPAEQEDLISVGDRWLYELNKLLTAARDIPHLLDEMRKS